MGVLEVLFETKIIFIPCLDIEKDFFERALRDMAEKGRRLYFENMFAGIRVNPRVTTDPHGSDLLVVDKEIRRMVIRGKNPGDQRPVDIHNGFFRRPGFKRLEKRARGSPVAARQKKYDGKGEQQGVRSFIIHASPVCRIELCPWRAFPVRPRRKQTQNA
jgi:hypothetical protein